MKRKFMENVGNQMKECSASVFYRQRHKWKWSANDELMQSG